MWCVFGLRENHKKIVKGEIVVFQTLGAGRIHAEHSFLFRPNYYASVSSPLCVVRYEAGLR